MNIPNHKIITISGRILCIFIFFCLIPCRAKSQGYIDSLETRLILVNNDEKLEILDIVIPFYFRNDPIQANKKAGKMLSLARQTGNKEFELKAQRYLAKTEALLKADHESALNNCFTAEENARSNGFIRELILTKLAIADIYGEIGNSTKALDYQMSAYHLADSIRDMRLSAIVINNQARSYIALKDLEKAEQSLKKSLKSARIHELTELEAETLMLFGDLYYSAFSHGLALEHYQASYAIFVSLRQDINVAVALFKMGLASHLIDLREEAFTHHLNALNIRKKIKDRWGLAESYNEIGLLYIESKEYPRAISNLRLGLSNAEMINANHLMQRSFDYLYQAYLGMRDFENAVAYQNRYIAISELIYAEASERVIQELTNKNEIAKREIQIKNLEEITERRNRELANSQKFNFTLALFLIVAIVFAIFLFRYSREKKRINKELAIKNDMITRQNNELIEANNTKDKFFSIIGHDLRGPLNSLSSFSNLLINHTASLTEDEIRTIARDLDKSLKNLYELLENLLGWARSQTGKLEFDPVNFNITDVLRENLRLLSKAALNKKIKIELIADDSLEVNADINSVRTIIRNLLSNAIKFTYPSGVISIFADEWKDSVEIGIHDTGVGMSKELMDKMFDVSAKHSTLGTNNEKGTGLGLILCREFIERNGGALTVESSPENGSTFKFTLPKKVGEIQNKPIEIDQG